jgi:hypothetical protein
VPKLPGDILVLLSGTRDYQFWEFRWFNLTEKKLLPAQKMPPGEWEIQPCHAALHRVKEYPNANYELFEGYRYPWSLWARRMGDASKIGGSWVMHGELQDPDDPDTPDYMKEHLREAWKGVRRAEREFLCQLFSPSMFGDRWPFLNVAKTGKGEANLLRIFDMGGIQLFFDGKKVRESLTSG